MWPQQILEMFSVDMKQRGTRLLLHLVYQLAIGRGMKEVVMEMAREEKLPRPALYRMMRIEAAPLLMADPETLEAVGLPALRKGTITELARNLARLVVVTP